MKRLIITGYPCSKQCWLDLFDDSNTTVGVPLSESLKKSNSADIKNVAKYIAGRIIDERPQSIICHDFGVPLTLLALLRISRQDPLSNTCLTLFNGAFRGFDVLKNRHPFALQFSSWKSVQSAALRSGAVVDPSLNVLHPQVKTLYRQVILQSLSEKLVPSRLRQPLVRSLEIPIQLISSSNDPYIARSAIERLIKDFKVTNEIELPYGHFPYSVRGSERDRLKKAVFDFESKSQ